MRCSTCSNPRVAEVNTLLQSGAPVRQVARLTGIPRTNLARHAAHIAPASRPFGLIEGTPDPLGSPDPLSEAIKLAEQARTPRERLRGLEQVRQATKLKLRGVELDSEDRRLLDRNIAEAAEAYESASDYETVCRALSGWREALLHRLDAVRAPDAIQTRLQVTIADGVAVGEGTPIRMRPGDYWRNVPQRYKDPERFHVERTIRLRFGVVQRKPGEPPDQELRVRDHDGALVWAGNR